MTSALAATAEALGTIGRQELAAVGGWDVQLEPGDLEAEVLSGPDAPSLSDRQHLRVSLQQGLRNELHGRGAVSASEEIAAGGIPTLRWETQLAGWLGATHRGDYRLYPFNRRHLHRGIMLPSLVPPGLTWLVAIVDTSGSVSAPVASRLITELDALRSAAACRMTLIQADDTVRAVRDIEAWEAIADGPGDTITIHGRGGTDFQPALDWVDRASREGDQPDAIVYLTDGYGRFPVLEPGWPVAWVVTPRGRSSDQFPFGDVIRLPPDASGTRSHA